MQRANLRRRLGLVLAACVAVALVLLAVPSTQPAQAAAIFMYHHVADDTPPSTSVTPAEFTEQMQYLEREGFRVLPLIDVLDALADGESLPDNAVAITFDDAYVSVLTEAAPQLAARDWPFTVFVNTEAIDSGYGGYLDWEGLRRIGAEGGTIGNHSVSHTHLVRLQPDESNREWLARVRREIVDAETRLEQELGEYLIPAFAYPFGEYTAEIKPIVEDLGLYGLGQHSGAVDASSDFLALPRYPVATGLALSEFALRARSKALPLSLVGPERHIVEPNEDRPTLRFALAGAEDFRRDELACYLSGQGRMPLAWRDDDKTEFIVRPDAALRSGRSKVNCTAPANAGGGVYYWYGYLWMRRLANGAWYDE